MTTSLASKLKSKPKLFERLNCYCNLNASGKLIMLTSTINDHFGFIRQTG